MLRTYLVLLVLLWAIPVRAGEPGQKLTAVDAFNFLMNAYPEFDRAQGRATPWDQVGVGFTVVNTSPNFDFVHFEGWGDCESGCIFHRYTYFTVSQDGKAEKLGAFGDSHEKADGAPRKKEKEGTPFWGIPKLAPDEATEDPDKWAEYLHSPKWWLRSFAIGKLAGLDKAKHRAEFFKALADEHPRVKQAALGALCWIADEKTELTDLLPLLKSPDKAVLLPIFQTIERSSDPNVLSQLEPFLRSDDPEVAYAALSALLVAHHRPVLEPAQTFVRKLMKQDPHDNRLMSVVYALGEWAHPSSVPVFLEVLELHDDTYDNNAVTNEDKRTEYTNPYYMLYDDALEGLQRVSGLRKEFKTFMMLPEQRKEMQNFWRKWWENERTAVLKKADHAWTNAEIAAVLQDHSDPRNSIALRELQQACQAGRANWLDFAPQMLTRANDVSLFENWNYKFWKLGGAKALEWLAQQAESDDYNTAQRAQSALKGQDAEDAWHLLFKARPRFDNLWEALLQDGWSLYDEHSSAPERIIKLRERFRADYHELIRATFATKFFAANRTARERAVVEKIEIPEASKTPTH